MTALRPDRLHTFWTALALVGVTLTACSSASKRMELRSTPSGADVYSYSGEKLGTTPIILERELITKAIRADRAELKLVAPGYAERDLILDVHGDDIHEVKLSAFSPEYFSDRLLKDYANQANPMVREALRIQGLLVVRKLDEAERALIDFIKHYPSIAAGHLLFANIEALRGNPAKARGYLLRARSIDPNDPVVLRMLGTTPARTPSSSEKGGK